MFNHLSGGSGAGAGRADGDGMGLAGARSVVTVAALFTQRLAYELSGTLSGGTAGYALFRLARNAG